MHMIEIYKIINNIDQSIMTSLFLFLENVHNIQNFQILSNSTKKTVRYNLEIVSYRSPFLWENLSQDNKSQNSLHAFKPKNKIEEC